MIVDQAPATGVPDLSAPTLYEIFGASDMDGAASGFLSAVLPQQGLVLWAQDWLTRRETGAVCLAGMGRALLCVDLSRPADVLSAMEDGLSCPALSAVVGEIWGDPPALDFTATRRLAMRAEAAGRPCWLLRRAAVANGSAARMRWRVSALPSDRPADDPAAPGDPRWRAELFRSRQTPPGQWVVTHDRQAHRLDFSALAADREMADPLPAHGRARAG